MNRITVSIGELAIPLEKYCEKHDKTHSEVIRAAVAKLLRVDNPPVEQGNPNWIAKRGISESKNTKG